MRCAPLQHRRGGLPATAGLDRRGKCGAEGSHRDEKAATNVCCDAIRGSRAPSASARPGSNSSITGVGSLRINRRSVQPRGNPRGEHRGTSARPRPASRAQSRTRIGSLAAPGTRGRSSNPAPGLPVGRVTGRGAGGVAGAAGAAGRPQAFLAQTLHQPAAATCLPAKIVHGAAGSVVLPWYCTQFAHF